MDTGEPGLKTTARTERTDPHGSLAPWTLAGPIVATAGWLGRCLDATGDADKAFDQAVAEFRKRFPSTGDIAWIHYHVAVITSGDG